MTYEFKTDGGKYRLHIKQDDDTESPRTAFDNLGTMFCSHSRYLLGDEQFDSRDFVGWEDVGKYLKKERDAAVILPLYLYDHSGITMSTTSFVCRWDSGQVGFVFVDRDKIKKEYEWQRLTKKRVGQIEDLLRSEVATYDQFLTGDIWGFVLEQFDGENWEEIDSCWGFYGKDIWTNGMVEHLDGEIVTALKKQK